MVPGGQAFAPVIVQQNSVYPSQQVDPQTQLEPLQLQIAAYAELGFRANVRGEVTAAEPTTATLPRKPRRSSLSARNPTVLSSTLVMSASTRRSIPW